MAQVLVGGDNEDAYSICEALEQKMADRSIPVLFCTTSHEVLANVGRGGVLAVVLSFEKAGLTNFELAYRIREAAEGAATAILIPEIDALGDVGGLGKQIGIFALPVDPAAVATQACRLIETAAKEQAAARTPTTPKATAKSAPGAPAGQREAAAELSRLRASVALKVAGDDGGPSGAPDSRVRRVRHRTWEDVRQGRRGGPRNAPSATAAAEIDDEDIVVTETRGPAAGRRPVKLAIALAAVALAVGAYHAIRILRASAGERDASSPGAVAEVLCTACGVREGRPVKDIHQALCRKCGGAMGFGYHCNDCKADFPFVPPKAVRALREVKTPPECPKCKSWNTAALPPDTGASE